VVNEEEFLTSPRLVAGPGERLAWSGDRVLPMALLHRHLAGTRQQAAD
jgi:hypothetical protein